MATETTTAPLRRPRIVEAIIFGVFIFLMGVGIAVHEPWFDEAQSWLLARDASVFDLLHTYLPYEGHPPLWYLVLKIATTAGLPYKSINVIGAGIATLGVLLLLLDRDAPLAVKALLPFTFFIAYQYTIVSRSYVMMFPILIGILAIYRRRRERLWLFVLLLVLLSQVSLHGTSIAGGLVLLYAYDVWRTGLPKGAELRKHLLAAAVLLLNVAAIAWMLRPPADIAIKSKLDFHFSAAKIAVLTLTSAASNLFGSDTPALTLASLIAFLLLVVWFARRRTLGTFITLVLCLVPITSVYFNIWHEGLFNLVMVFTILLTFAHANDEPRTARDGQYDRVMLVLVAVIFINSVADTWRSYGFDIAAPYSGSRSAADFIQTHHLDRARLFGAGFSCIGIEPYFDHNVFGNYQTYGHFSFWDWSKKSPWFYRPRNELRLADLQAWQATQLAQKPDFVLTSTKFITESEYGRMAEKAGYREIAFFPGAMFWKDRIIESESFRLFVRGDLAPGAQH
jgi:hypothetical protein